MPPRPFRQSLSIGTDICHYPRFTKYFPIHQHLASTTTAISSQTLLFKLFDKAFLPAEQRAFWRRFQPSSRRDSAGGETEQQQTQTFWTEKKAEEAARYLGGRWAAKEAVIKALTPQRRLVLRDVRVWSVGSGKQPLAIVVDEVEGVKYAPAKEVYEGVSRQMGLVEELRVLQKGGSAAVASPSLRIIKKAILSRHSARSMEMKKALPQETETSTEQPPTPTPTPSILSETGVLDLNAINQALQQDGETSTQTTQEETGTDEDPQREQARLQNEIQRLLNEEQAEDGWDNAQGQVVKLSISHDGEYCVATALAALEKMV
jgi:phosphopantetheinyl transferase (holo-ACP synthase)